MAVTANFNSAAALLAVLGDNLANTIAISRDAAGTLRVNGGAVAIKGGTATVANTTRMQVFGLGGNDTISLDEAAGALPAATLFGGAGNDTLIGGSAADQIFGQADNDILLGKGGADQLFGGAGNDTLTGGTGDDMVFGESGNDRMIWNPGDDTDLFEGGADNDTAEVNGGNGGETFAITANGSRVRFDRLDPAPFALDIGTTENLVLNANGGDDVISAVGNLAALITLTIDGGAGNDTITGGNGKDLLLGGSGDDIVRGAQGDDTALLGAGNDTFIWNPGDGSDVVEGQAGNDTMLFNGSNAAENIDIAANGGRLRFFRNVANITMDVNDVEVIDFRALGGADNIVVNDLSGTDATEVAIDLSSNGGGDAQADTVSLSATAGNDQINVLSNGGSVIVQGLAAQVTIKGAEAANDLLVINGQGGNDTINAAALAAGSIKLTIDGGAGNDTIVGSVNNDTALLGTGDDRFIWNPGDGSDIVEGQDGTDTLEFNGSNAAETIDISANGGRARFFRDVANVTMDLDDMEAVHFRALGGADTIVVGDLSGTDVKHVTLDLAAANSTKGDAQSDQVTASGTNGGDAIKVANANGAVTVTGLAAQLTILRADSANDTLVINALAGDDTIDASALAAAQVKLTINAGLGIDTITGSGGSDLVNGGDGNDTAFLGGGDDVFVWNPGDDDDKVEGQAGNDTLLFNGANVAENIDIAAFAGRVRFFRNVANVTMDLDDTETIDFRALGGADNVVVNDLTGTDVTTVRIDLAAVGGSDDAQPDTIFVNGTNGDDVITLTNSNGVVTVSGLAADIVIANFHAGDRIVINGLDGNDVIDATGLSAVLQLTADGGNGDDILLGSNGDDVLTGGAGDDVLIGGPGTDILDGGPDDNVVIQLVGSGAMIDASAPGMRFILDDGSGDEELRGVEGNQVRADGPGVDRFDFPGGNGLALDSFSDLQGQIAPFGADSPIGSGSHVGPGAGMHQDTILAAVKASDFALS